jgi:hypothetical protein
MLHDSLRVELPFLVTILVLSPLGQELDEVEDIPPKVFHYEFNAFPMHSRPYHDMCNHCQ